MPWWVWLIISIGSLIAVTYIVYVLVIIVFFGLIRRLFRDDLYGKRRRPDLRL